jgi:uncharacterized protein
MVSAIAQEEAVSFLADYASHRSSEPVEQIETHISRIFLAGDRAFKTKRAVKYPYVDFSTPELRLDACRKEVQLNSITAPGLYLGVRRITRGADGKLSMEGDGELVESVIEMIRFDQSKLLDRMAQTHELTPRLMTDIASMIVRFHRGVPARHIMSGSANIAAVLGINEAGLAGSGMFSNSELAPFNAAFRATLARHASLLDRREAAGKVRRCHGDLHLRNICMLDGEPRLFDCIEFNDQIATVDVLYDLAFLLMDLWHRGFPEFANLIANRYLDESDDEDGFVLLPFFMAVRAAVRAHVAATQAKGRSGDRGKLAAEARSYFDLARSMLQPGPARIIAIGGLSGSGKTTVAEVMAAHVGAPPGARIVESDGIRKAMHGVAPETKLPDKAYRPEVSANVYREMAWRASLILAEGGSVVADAVFDNAANRQLIESAATVAGVSFVGVWLDTDASVLWQRVSSRRQGVSDATVDILSRQLQRRTGGIAWPKIDAALPPSAVAARILALPPQYAARANRAAG